MESLNDSSEVALPGVTFNNNKIIFSEFSTKFASNDETERITEEQIRKKKSNFGMVKKRALALINKARFLDLGSQFKQLPSLELESWLNNEEVVVIADNNRSLLFDLTEKLLENEIPVIRVNTGEIVIQLINRRLKKFGFKHRVQAVIINSELTDVKGSKVAKVIYEAQTDGRLDRITVLGFFVQFSKDVCSMKKYVCEMIDKDTETNMVLKMLRKAQ